MSDKEALKMSGQQATSDLCDGDLCTTDEVVEVCRDVLTIGDLIYLYYRGCGQKC
jgi:hypothetical protein